jgi:hypothetical protein
LDVGIPRKLLGFLAAAASSAAAGQTLAIVTGPLSPATKWALDYGYTQCVAARDFGSQSDPTSLAIRPAPNGKSYELLVARAGRGPEFAEELEGTVDFGRGPIKSWLLRYHTIDRKRTLYMFRLSASDMAQARTATSVRFQAKGSINTAVALTSMAALLDGLETCTADLKRYWNEGGNKDGRIVTQAKGDVRSIFNDGDFPQEALGRHQDGKAQFLLLIDEKGKIAACHIEKASGIPALDAMGCQVIMERARFKPALDAAGKPVRSMYWTPEVIWRFG